MTGRETEAGPAMSVAEPARQVTKAITMYDMTFLKATAATPRVDCHSLPHLKDSKAALACNAADCSDGQVLFVNPTLKVLVAAYNVSVAYIVAAKRLSADERDAVRRGERPLVIHLPTPRVADPLARVGALVEELGVSQLLSLVATHQGEQRFTWWQLEDDWQDIDLRNVA
jgi:hypothetical protein